MFHCEFLMSPSSVYRHVKLPVENPEADHGSISQGPKNPDEDAESFKSPAKATRSHHVKLSPGLGAAGGSGRLTLHMVVG